MLHREKRNTRFKSSSFQQKQKAVFLQAFLVFASFDRVMVLLLSLLLLLLLLPLLVDGCGSKREPPPVVVPLRILYRDGPLFAPLLAVRRSVVLSVSQTVNRVVARLPGPSLNQLSYSLARCFASSLARSLSAAHRQLAEA